MLLKIEIDLENTIEDMFHDESNDLTSAIKGEILSSVMNQVMPKMKKSIDELVSQRIDKIVTDRVEATVDSIIGKALEGDGLIMINGQPKTVKKHIEDIFQSARGWNNPHDRIAKIAEAFANDLRTQYNNVFAMNIVTNLKDNGLLKDDVALFLTKQNDKK